MRKKLSSSLSVEALLETGAKDTWASIRKLLNRETEVPVSEFSTAVANFELDNETVAKMKQHLKDYARNVVETKAREEAGKIMIHMKDRFARVFNYDSDSMPRVWTGNEDIRSITKDARTDSLGTFVEVHVIYLSDLNRCFSCLIISFLQSLKLLLTMAAIRLDEKPDNIENVLVSSLVDGTVPVSSSQNRKLGPSTDPLASSSWEEVSSKDNLITSVQCKSLWRQFKPETEYSVTQAILAQEPSLPHGSICCIFTFKGLMGTDGHYGTVPAWRSVRNTVHLIKVSTNCHESSKKTCGRSSGESNTRSTKAASFSFFSEL